MKNLILLSESRRHTQLSGSDAPWPENANRFIVDVCDVLGDGKFLLANDGILVKVSENGEDLLWVSYLNEACENSQQVGEWFSLSFTDTEQFVCLSRSGAIVTVSPYNGQTELVGEFDHGIEAGCWSPDGEVLLLVTFAEEEQTLHSVLLSMNTQWEVLAENHMEKHVPFSKDDDNTTVAVSWRPDGNLCAVSTLDVADNQRKVRIYERESLQLHAIGRTEDGSGKLVPSMVASAGLAWAGSGCSQLLTTVQRKGRKIQQVIFFEPNGLRHREFVLREVDPSSTQVLGLDWNAESDLLAVTIRDEASDKVQLWHRSNYHWYLKQELRYQRNQLARVLFHQEQPYFLTVLFRGTMDWREYDFLWDSSTTHVTSTTCTAYAIDGCILNMTPFHKAIAPPPMYAGSINMKYPIQHIAFAVREEHPIHAVVYLSNGSLVLLGSDGERSKMIANFSLPNVVAEGMIPAHQGIEPMALRSLVVVDDDPSCVRCIAITPASRNMSTERLVDLKITWDQDKLLSVNVNGVIPLNSRVLRCIQWSCSSKGALLEMEDGHLMEFTVTDDHQCSLSDSDIEDLLEPCPWIAGLKGVNGKNEEMEQHGSSVIIGMTARNRLYCQDLLLSDSVSSFFLSMEHQFLSYVTSGAENQLRFIPFSDLRNFDPLMGSDSFNVVGYEPRNVEIGTRLVGIVPTKPTAILQLPRGNLEGVYPRALVLRYVMMQIQTLHYDEALSMMRRQKVDLNLIVDLNPHHFLHENGVSEFLEQVRSIDHLNLFISLLQNWDITQTRYHVPEWFPRNSNKDGAEEESFDFSTKVNQVCTSLRSLMLEAERERSTKGGRAIEDGHYLLPILSTFAKEDPPQLEQALMLIKENALQKHPKTSKKAPLFSDTAQSSIQYLAFLADYELLFETALGMYDYDVARAVARNSQMDPKVYLPLLKRYRELPEFYGRYEVDLRLKRYENALRNLFESGQKQESLENVLEVASEEPGTIEIMGNDFESCMKLIKEHSLFHVGLQLFCLDEEKMRVVKLSLGSHLIANNQAESALSIFLSVMPVDIELAKEAARACRDWKCYFSLLQQGTIDEESLKKIANDVVEEITGEHYATEESLVDGARILLDYCDDVDGAVDLYIRAHLWSDGRRVAFLFSQPALAQKCTDAAVSYSDSTSIEMEDRTETFLTTIARYIQVLDIRKKQLHEMGGDGSYLEGDTESLFSQGSNASNYSLQSNMSNVSAASGVSISSVISVKSTSSFSITGSEQTMRHKSKFNNIGRNKKKKKKRKEGRNRMKPEDELKSLVQTLQSSCLDEKQSKTIGKTITFLLQMGELSSARSLYDCYELMRDKIEKAQVERIETARKDRLAEQKKAMREGQHFNAVVLPAEEVVDKLRCSRLTLAIYDTFSFLKLEGSE